MKNSRDWADGLQGRLGPAARAIRLQPTKGIRLTNSLTMAHPSSFSALTHPTALTADMTVSGGITSSVWGWGAGLLGGRIKCLLENLFQPLETTECCGVTKKPASFRGQVSSLKELQHLPL